MLDDAFASIALGFSAAMGGPYHAAVVRDQGEAEYDDGGSIITPADAIERPCSVQVDQADEAMRSQNGFSDKDMRLLVIGLPGDLNTDAVVSITEGPDAGDWSVQACQRDPVAIGWVVRGRHAS